VALSVSVQSGNWHDPATWDAGLVPTSADDVIVSSEHEVIIESGQHVSISDGHILSIAENATLRIQGELDIGGSEFWIIGTVYGQSGYLVVWDGANMRVSPLGTLEIAAGLQVESDAAVTVEGQFIIASSGYADIYSHGVLTVEIDATWQDYGQCRVEGYGKALVHGDSSIENGGVLEIYDQGVVQIDSAGAIFILGTFNVLVDGRMETFGYLGLDDNGLLHISLDGLINVYKDIHVSGRMTGGGRIEMLRREGRILDYDGNSLFALDRVYGLQSTRIM